MESDQAQLTQTHQEVRQLARSFVDREVAPRVVSYNRAGQLPADLVEKAVSLGFVGGAVPERYGGSGMDHISWSICVEEIARYCTSLAAVVGYPSSLAGRGLLRWGTEQQKRRFLIPLAAGRCLAATAITEPDTGSDAAAMRTIARADGDNFRLSGQKTWISNANSCQWMIVFASVDRTKKKEGITAFLVDRDTEGVDTRPIRHKLANRISDTGEVYFQDVLIERDRVLGDVGAGWSILTESVAAGRVHVAARSVGIAQGCLELSVRYAQERKAFGREIARMQLVQQMISEMAVGIESGRMLVHRAAQAIEEDDRETGYWTSLAKLHASRVAMSAAHDAVQIHGANGFSDEFHVERHFREAKMQEVVDGTSEIQQLIVANALMRS